MEIGIEACRGEGREWGASGLRPELAGLDSLFCTQQNRGEVQCPSSQSILNGWEAGASGCIQSSVIVFDRAKVVA